MIGADRKELIVSLADAMGMSGEKKKAVSSYDATTGTVYCGSRVYQPSDVQNARIFLTKYFERLKKQNDKSFAFFEIALSCIELIEMDMAVSSGGRIVVKEGY